MSKDQKESIESPKIGGKKSLRIIVLLILIAFSVLAAAYFFINENEKLVDQDPIKVINEEKVSITDSIELVEEDSNRIEVEMEQKVEVIQHNSSASPKKKRIDYNNSAKYWKISLVNNQDTSYYVIKNRVSGLTLSNRYYSKSEAEKELQNFKNIIQ